MAGTVAANILSDRGTGDSLSIEQVIVGCAKAWWNVDMVGVSLRNEYNVSSHDDNAAGDYDVNYTNAMTNATYSAPLCCGRETAWNDRYSSWDTAGFTTGYLNVISRDVSVENGTDAEVNVGHVLGVLA